MKKVIASTVLLFALLSAHGQYMSYFGDSTWEYHVTYITQPPEDYLNYPPEEPNLLGVYCRTLIYKYTKDAYTSEYGYYYSVPLHGGNYDWVLQEDAPLSEDTVNGRLYVGSIGGYLICDMSLSEGDTFIYEGMCDLFYNGVYAKDLNTKEWIQLDTIRFTMIVDSVRYISDKKTIYLSLLDHLDDYFFGTGNEGRLSDYHLSIRFIEGIGPTYGIMSTGCMFPYADSLGNLAGRFKYFDPWLSLLQCMYKDDTLVYLVHEGMGCNQTCVGIKEHPQLIMNLYPNPATQYVVLDLSTGNEMSGDVMVTDILGKRCLQQKVEGVSFHISITDLPTGMYFLTYSDGERTVTRKFLKK